MREMMRGKNGEMVPMPRRVRSFVLTDEHSQVQYIQILRRKNKWRVLRSFRRYKPW